MSTGVDYFVTAVCSIRIVQQSSAVGFIYPKFEHFFKIQLVKYKGVQIVKIIAA